MIAAEARDFDSFRAAARELIVRREELTDPAAVRELVTSLG